jgi:hypothetical protein
MHVDMGSLAQQFLDCHEVEKVTPPPNRRAAKNDLGDSVLPYKIGDRTGDFASLNMENPCGKVFREAQIRCQIAALLFNRIIG